MSIFKSINSLLKIYIYIQFETPKTLSNFYLFVSDFKLPTSSVNISVMQKLLQLYFLSSSQILKAILSPPLIPKKNLN